MDMSLADLPSVFSSEHNSGGRSVAADAQNAGNIKQALSGIDEIKSNLKKSSAGTGSGTISTTIKVDTISIDSDMYKKDIDPGYISESCEIAKAFERVKGKSIKDRDMDDIEEIPFEPQGGPTIGPTGGPAGGPTGFLPVKTINVADCPTHDEVRDSVFDSAVDTVPGATAGTHKRKVRRRRSKMISESSTKDRSKRKSMRKHKSDSSISVGESSRRNHEKSTLESLLESESEFVTQTETSSGRTKRTKRRSSRSGTDYTTDASQITGTGSGTQYSGTYTGTYTGTGTQTITEESQTRTRTRSYFLTESDRTTTDCSTQTDSEFSQNASETEFSKTDNDVTESVTQFTESYTRTQTLDSRTDLSRSDGAYTETQTSEYTNSLDDRSTVINRRFSDNSQDSFKTVTSRTSPNCNTNSLTVTQDVSDTYYDTLQTGQSYSRPRSRSDNEEYSELSRSRAAETPSYLKRSTSFSNSKSKPSSLYTRTTLTGSEHRESTGSALSLVSQSFREELEEILSEAEEKLSEMSHSSFTTATTTPLVSRKSTKSSSKQQDSSESCFTDSQTTLQTTDTSTKSTISIQLNGQEITPEESAANSRKPSVKSKSHKTDTDSSTLSPKSAKTHSKSRKSKSMSAPKSNQSEQSNRLKSLPDNPSMDLQYDAATQTDEEEIMSDAEIPPPINLRGLNEELLDETKRKTDDLKTKSAPEIVNRTQTRCSSNGSVKAMTFSDIRKKFSRTESTAKSPRKSSIAGRTPVGSSVGSYIKGETH